MPWPADGGKAAERGGRRRCPRHEGWHLGVLIRSILSAISVVVLIPVAFAIGGGYFPRMPVIGPFGTILNTGLPWIVGAAAAATGFAGIAVALGGRKTIVLLVATLVLLAGAGFVAYRYTTFAQANGAQYDIVRAIDGFPPIPAPTQTVVFATVDGIDLKADLWIPDSAETAALGTVPAVVFIHGGAFVGGAPGTRPLLMAALAKGGIVAIDADYRLSPPPRWNEAPADVLCALGWLGSVDGLEVVDQKRVVLAGESAGGSLVLVAGFAAGTGAIASSCPDDGPPIVPAGIVAIAPAADLAGIWEDETINDYFGDLFPEAYIGGTPAQYPDRYDAASPFRYLHRDVPPTLILAGEIDRLVHLERVTSIADKAREVGAPVELRVVPFVGHGFDGEPNSFGDQLVEGIIPNFALDPIVHP